MAKRRLKRPRDPVQLAKLIGDIATGQVVDEVEDSEANDKKLPKENSEERRKTDDN